MTSDPFHGRSSTFDDLPWFTDSTLNSWLCAMLAPYGRSICDVGAGTGLMALEYVKWFDRSVLVEPSETMRQRLKARIGENETLEVVNASGEALPLADDSVDISLSKNALHHSTDSTLCLAEMARVAKSALAVVEVALPSTRCRGYLTELLTRKEPGRSPATLWEASDIAAFASQHAERTHLLIHDQYIDLDLWLESSPLPHEEIEALKVLIRTQPADVVRDMQLHYRGGKLVQLRRIVLAVGLMSEPTGT